MGSSDEAANVLKFGIDEGTDIGFSVESSEGSKYGKLDVLFDLISMV